MTFLRLVLLGLVFLSTAVPGRGAGFNGEWHGTLRAGIARFRVALQLHRDRDGMIRGSFNNIDDGIYGQTFQCRAEGGSFRALLPTGEKLELRLGPAARLLEGTYTQAHGSFQVPGKVSRLVLSRGKGFLVPRLWPEDKADRRYVYRRPMDLGDGWPTGDLAESGADAREIFAGMQKVVDGSFPNIHSVSLVRGGKLLLDEYFYGYGPREVHPLQSATKSVFSLLAGIAVDRGMIRLDDRLYDFFPSYRTGKRWRPEKQEVTLRSLLTMTSGFACDDWKAPKACSWAMVSSPDWLDFCLSEPLDHRPGGHFAYCGACLTPFSELICRQSGMGLPAFARKYLFGPLGIRKAEWMEAPGTGPGPGGAPLTPVSFGLSLRPRDLAKIGQLVLQKGEWRGRRVLSAGWVGESTALQVPALRTRSRAGYGYLWWVRDLRVRGRSVRTVYAWGVGGQYLFVVPGMDLVCVVTGGNYKSARLGADSFRLFRDYLLPAFAAAPARSVSSREPDPLFTPRPLQKVIRRPATNRLSTAPSG